MSTDNLFFILKSLSLSSNINTPQSSFIDVESSPSNCSCLLKIQVLLKASEVLEVFGYTDILPLVVVLIEACGFLLSLRPVNDKMPDIFTCCLSDKDE